MSSHQTLGGSVETLLQVTESLKNEALDLEECLKEFEKSVEAFKACQNILSKHMMDVKEAKFVAGQWVESDYDWQK